MQRRHAVHNMSLSAGKGITGRCVQEPYERRLRVYT